MVRAVAATRLQVAGESWSAGSRLQLYAVAATRLPVRISRQRNSGVAVVAYSCGREPADRRKKNRQPRSGDRIDGNVVSNLKFDPKCRFVGKHYGSPCRRYAAARRGWILVCRLTPAAIRCRRYAAASAGGFLSAGSRLQLYAVAATRLPVRISRQRNSGVAAAAYSCGREPADRRQKKPPAAKRRQNCCSVDFKF